MRFDLDLRIQIVKPVAGSLEFRHTDRRCAVENLAMQIRNVDVVEVGETDPSDACGSEIHQYRTAEASGADDEYGSALELLLSLLADFGKNEVARVAFALEFGKHGCWVTRLLGFWVSAT